ncbi:MAG: MBL fold metallo-hydrolase [Bacillota bacterium]|nr:MBL fold metallo-hydrolase [Bacillota bacterium]
MKLQILVDNVANAAQGEWGFSAFIQADGKHILFDVGASGLFLQNAQILGVDLLDLDYVVLSHGHWDHTWGLDTLVKHYMKNTKAKRPALVAHPQAFERTYNPKGDENGALIDQAVLEGRLPLQLSKEPIWLTERLLWLGQIERVHDYEYVKPKGTRLIGATREPDLAPDDSALAYCAADGLVIITGCSHSGICNIIEQARRLTGETRVVDIIGGTHLLQPTHKQMDATVEYMRKLNPALLHPGHCTSLAAKIALAAVAPVKELFVGLELEYK